MVSVDELEGRYHAPLVLDTVAVAQLLRVHPSTVRAMVSAGSIPVIRCGRLLRFSRAAIERWLNGEESMR